MTHPRPALRWLRELSTRRAPAAALPVAADVVDPIAVRGDVAAIARDVRPLLASPDAAGATEPPPYVGSAVVPPMPDWAPGQPFGMARWDR